MYKDHISIGKIAKENNVSYSTMHNAISKLGYKVRHMPQMKYDVEYFKTIDTEEKAYWLGFIFADGSLHKDKQLTIELDIKDYDHIVKFESAIKRNKIPYTYKRRRGNETVKAVVFGKEFCGYLMQYGLHAKKANDCVFPKNIPKYLIRHFIRGYFDGDGSIFMRSRDKKYRWSVLSFSGTLDMLQNIHKAIPTHMKMLLEFKQNMNWELKVSKRANLVAWYRWLYSDVHIYLDRKYSKWQEVLSYIESRRGVWFLS